MALIYKAYQTKSNHVLTLLSSLEDMMKDGFICDFIVKVGEDAFAVHRVVLAGCSKYFKAMFSSEMKEAKEGFVLMSGVETIAMKISIDFMYTGTAEIDYETVECTLSAATLMQLDGLAELCFHFLEANIAVDSCLRFVLLSDIYGRESLKESAKMFVARHLEDVIDEPNFPEIPEEDLICYIKSSIARHEITWKAVVVWMTADFDSTKSLFQGLLRSLNIEHFSFELFHEMLMNESMLQGADDLKAVLVEEWFSDFTTFKGHLSTKNYYTIKLLIAEYSVPNENQFIEHLAHYFGEHFEELSQQEEFLTLCEEEILPIFQSMKNQLLPEKEKWNTAINWVKYNESRMKTFPILFESINLNLLPRQFIQDEILDEALVKESNQCKDTLLKYLGSMPIPATHMTCLSQSNGEIMTFNPTNNKCEILTVVPGGIGIANVKGDLYLVTLRNLYRLNRNGTWTILPSPPRNVEQGATVLHLRQCVYIIGRNSLQWFNPVTNVWLSRYKYFEGGISQSCRWSVTDGACFAGLDNALYQFGGHDPQSAVLYHFVGQNPPKKLNNASALSSENNPWVPIASMNVKRAYASAEVVRKAIWVLGGGDKSVETYNPVVNVWTLMSEMVFPRERFGACVVGERLFAVGGAQRIPTTGSTFGDVSGVGIQGSSSGSGSGVRLHGPSFGARSGVELLDSLFGAGSGFGLQGSSFGAGSGIGLQGSSSGTGSGVGLQGSSFEAGSGFGLQSGFSSVAAHQSSPLEDASKDESFMEEESVEAYEESRKKWRVVQTVKKLSGNISCCPYSPPPEVEKLVHLEKLNLQHSTSLAFSDESDQAYIDSDDFFYNSESDSDYDYDSYYYY